MKGTIEQVVEDARSETESAEEAAEREQDDAEAERRRRSPRVRTPSHRWPTTTTRSVAPPEGPVFDGEVVQLSTRTVIGEIGVLANHAPVVGRLVPAPLRLHLSENETLRWAGAGGLAGGVREQGGGAHRRGDPMKS